MKMCQKIKLIGITGGIGSGKSYVCRLLETYGIPLFYTDDEAKRLIRTHAPLRRCLTDIVGPALYDADGRLEKSVMAAYLCSGPEAAARVDAVVHPCVAEAFTRWAARQTPPLAVMECALLFESGFNRLVHTTVMIDAPLETRITRVMQRDRITRAQALHWIALQMPDNERRRRADHIILNDGTAALEPQISRILEQV